MASKLLTIFSPLFLISVFSGIAFAHAVVKPGQVGVAKTEIFTVGVPSEHQANTVGIKLLIPDGLGDVTANVKQGWKVTLIKDGTGDDAKIKEIDWTGGSIPPGMRDDFYFSAEVPAQNTTLIWKIYQTYDDGSVVAWDESSDEDAKNPQKDESTATKGPYSETVVANDLETQPQRSNNTVTPGVATSMGPLPVIISVLSLSMSIVALAISVKRSR